MATSLSSNTFSSVYRDDYQDSDNYHRILFNGGKALQARELTQSQTIINKELERLGTNLFLSGGAVTGGNITVNNKVEFIKLNNTALSEAALEALVGTFYRDTASPNVIVKILEVYSNQHADWANDTLIVEYVDTGGTGGSATDSVRLGNSKTLERITTLTNTAAWGDTVNFPNVVTVSSGASGLATKAHVAAGSFFVQGRFVFVKAQSIFVSQYTQYPNEDIGFQITEDIVTTTDDTALFDNSNPGSPNLASPGADRYRIKLELKTRTVAGSNNFIYLARVNKGVIADEVKTNNSYNLINDVLAKRTKEESGNYAVRGFDLNIRSVDSPNIEYSLGQGTAYVDGYRINLDQNKISKPIPITTEDVDAELTSATWGNYIVGYGSTMGSAAPYDSDGIYNKGLPKVRNFEKFNLYKALNGEGKILGTARCRAIYKDESNHYRFYLFDIRMKPNLDADESFAAAKSFGTVPSSGSLAAKDYVNIVLEGGIAVLKGTSNNNLLFPLPKGRPTFGGVDGSFMTVQRKYSDTTGGASTTLSGSVGGGMGAGVGIHNFVNPTQWVISAADSAIEPATVTITGGGTTFGVTGLRPSTTYDILAQVSVTGNTDVARRSKSLAEHTLTKTWPTVADSDGRGLKFISLDKPDIFTVKSIRLTDSNGSDLSDNFTLDNGQRDNYYGIGRLIPKANVTIPNGNIFIRFQSFGHTASEFGNGSVGAQKCYFDVGSYSGQEEATSNLVSGQTTSVRGVTYGTIPDYTTSDGVTHNLRDVLDFRPVATLQHSIDSARPTGQTGSTGLDSGNNYHNITFDSNGAGGNPLIHLLPQSGGTIQSNNTYYLPRKDRIVLSTKNNFGERNVRGALQYLQGTPSFEPTLPVIPDGSMPLYDITLNARTIDKTDLVNIRHNNKRFTMSDIARLENRIDNLEEITTLSLLELNTSTLNVIDSAGNPRTKSGFLVDNFADYTFTDVNSNEQRASIDPVLGHLTPLASPISNRLFWDSSQGGTTLQAYQHADILLLPMSDSAVSFLYQDVATTTENINPFAVITSIGHIELSPSTDTWVETQWAADDVQSGGTIQERGSPIVTSQSLGAWRNNWIGNPTGWTGGRDRSGNTVTVERSRSVAVRSSVRFVTTQIGDRVLSIDILPFMRSIKVYFKAQGLRRGTRHFPYFANTAIDNYTKQEAFQRWSQRNEDVGNIYTNSTIHPDTSSNLVTDSNGTITGSFIIPSNSSLRFNTGSQVFKLLDISGGEDSDAISSGNTIFTSAGTLETRQRIMSTTRVEAISTVTERFENSWTIPRFPRDPLAQSFAVNIIENPNGVYITKCRIFFATKPDNFGVPVQCQIRPMENGVPFNMPIPGAIKFLNPSQVTATAISGTNMTTIQGAGTDFIFDEAIYLAPGQEYAVVVMAESTDYTVYVAQTYEFLVGTTAKRVSKQPTLGSLFASQNGSAWTPEQDKDLMFHLFRAEFSASGEGYFTNTVPSSRLLGLNPLQTVSGDSDIIMYHPNHGFSKDDKVTISGVSGTIAGVAAASINGNRTVTAVDHRGFTFGVAQGAAAPTDNLRGGENAVITTNNVIYNAYVPQLQTLELPSTTITAQAKHTTGRSYAGGSTRTAGKTYTQDTSYSDIILNEINYTNESKVILGQLGVDSSGSITNPLLIKVNMTTTDTKVSPQIDLQRTNIIGFENKIDDAITTNAPIGTAVAETNAVDGSQAAKHITRVVNLEELSVGLKILFGANRPGEASFLVYYRTGTGDDDLSTIPWILQAEYSNNPSDNDTSVFREYEYLPGGMLGDLDGFTKFQIKIVMTSTNQSRIPTIKDLRVIAMVT